MEQVISAALDETARRRILSGRPRLLFLGVNRSCGSVVTRDMDFADTDIAHALGAADERALDALEFGVISMTLDGVVEGYNAYESRCAGLTPARVMGKHFFTEVAPCTNNYLVASRFEECASLDERLPYVFTLRMRPRPVELRLVKAQGAERQYVLVRAR